MSSLSPQTCSTQAAATAQQHYQGALQGLIADSVDKDDPKSDALHDTKEGYPEFHEVLVDRPEPKKGRTEPMDDALEPKELCPGQMVCIHSVKSHEFNGLFGTCVLWDDDRGRWHVRFEDGQVTSFKPENLKACQGQPEDFTKAASTLKPGSKVETHGLQAQEFNSLRGTCKSWLVEKGRWIVVLDNVQEGKEKEKSFRPENLKSLPGQEIVVNLISGLSGSLIVSVTLGAGSSIGDLKEVARKALQHKTVRLMLGQNILKHDSSVGDSGLYSGCAVEVYKLPNTMQLSKILGESLVKGSLERAYLTSALEGPKILGILIDGDWCPHSRPFVFGQLKPFYDKVNEVSKRFEVVFCSDTQDNFAGYRELFPKDCKWFAVPFESREVIAKINQREGGYGAALFASRLKCIGLPVPNLTFVTPTGEIIERCKPGCLPQGSNALVYLQHLEQMADAKMSLCQ